MAMKCVGRIRWRERVSRSRIIGNSVTTINPRNGHFGATLPVADPYNLYFTPDGKYGIVVAERLARLDFVNPRTMKLKHALPVNCRGVQ